MSLYIFECSCLFFERFQCLCSYQNWRNIVLLAFRYRFDSFNVLDSNGYEASSLFLMLSKRRKNSRYLDLKTSHIQVIKAIVDMQKYFTNNP